MSENKVQFNLSNVHYAVFTETVNSLGVHSYSYGTVKAIPGGVTLTLDAAGDATTFYADGLVYYKTTANNGYTGSLEVARIPDQMLQDVWMMNLTTTDKTLIEKSNVEPKEIALLYQIDGDVGSQYYCLYRCSLGRPGIGSTTNTETKEPQTQTVDISAMPRSDYRVMARTTESSPSGVKSGWFNAVYTG